MPNVEVATASPEKRLFISLLTRDIPLTDAFLDLIDNSINSAMVGIANKLTSAQSYADVLSEPVGKSIPSVYLMISEEGVVISDSSTGISLKSARDHVFRFGRQSSGGDINDRLSVYGVGLKRAIFKIGNRIKIKSDHREAGFSMDMDVQKWEQDPRQPWVIDIESRPKVAASATGTRIEIMELYDDVRRRVSDGVFIGELREKIQRAYAFFLGKVVDIFVNGQKVERPDIEIGENIASEEFSKDGVECRIVAGIGVPDERGFFVDSTAGWSIFCNGRNVVFADKTALTGWVGSPELPIFQPKHRPFRGAVFFVSTDPEKLPWTTTKSAINRESGLWQEARKRMVAVGKPVVGFLDRRYDNEGTIVTSSDVKVLAGKKTSLLQISTATVRRFETTQVSQPITIKIQFDADTKEVDAVREYLRKPFMSGSDVGRHVFRYFLKNRVRYEQ